MKCLSRHVGWLLRRRTGGFNFDVVRVFQRWDGKGRQDTSTGPGQFSATQARTWKRWTNAHRFARSHVAQYPRFSVFGCASAFLKLSCERPSDVSWYQMIAGVMSVRLSYNVFLFILYFYNVDRKIIILQFSLFIAVYVEESMDWRDPAFLEAFQAETFILQKRVEACKSHVLLVTCFDSCPSSRYIESPHNIKIHWPKLRPFVETTLWRVLYLIITKTQLV